MYILYILNNFYNIFNICNLAKCVLSFILFNKFYMCVNMYYKLIFINKFIRHNRVNDSCCNIKYLYITILIFLIMFYLSLITFFFSFIYRIVSGLFTCIHEWVFQFTFTIFLCKKPRWKIQHQVYLIMYWCFQFDHYSHDFSYFSNYVFIYRWLLFCFSFIYTIVSGLFNWMYI